MGFLPLRLPRRYGIWGLGGLFLLTLIGVALWMKPWGGDSSASPAPAEGSARRESGPSAEAEAEAEVAAEAGAPDAPEVVRLDEGQQRALGIATARVQTGKVSAVLSAPGQVVPDESHFAYITPRARGIVRSVNVQIGQYVTRGELLAEIDSEKVADSRLQLINALQQLEIAQAKLNWQETIYHNSLDMIAALQEGTRPEEIQMQFADRPVGQTREELLRAYAQFYLSRITKERYENLQKKEAVSVALYQEKLSQYQVDQAVFQGLLDRMGYQVTLEYTQTRQALREARTAVKVARETLRVLGVSVAEIVEKYESGELTADRARKESPQKTLAEAAQASAHPSHEVSDLIEVEGQPVSTYEIRAPFDGTILERERIVPGVVVDGLRHLFTMADLATVWVEVHVHESDFDLLARGQGGLIEFNTPAYPRRTFRGNVLYTGDMVDQKSRTIRLLATAENPGRLLKPGMFVTVEIHSENARQLPEVPESALLTEGGTDFVFVRGDAGEFRRRVVRVGNREEGRAAILDGLGPGEEVVVRGAFALKSKWLAARSRESAAE